MQCWQGGLHFMVKTISRKTKIIAGIIFAIILVTGLFIKLYSNPINFSPEFCFVVEKGNIVDSLDLQGTLSSEKIKDVMSDAQGEVRKINVSINQLVSKKENVMALENKSLRNDLPIKKKSLDLAGFELKISKNKYEQAQLLYEKGAISKDEIDKAYLDYQRSIYSNYESAKKSYEEVYFQINNLKVSAPFTGAITDVCVKEGELVTKSQKLFSIIDINRPIVVVSASKNYANILRNGQKVYLTNNNIGNVSGFISNIKSDYNPKENKNESITITCKPIKPLDTFLYGLTLDVKIIINQRNDTIKIPITAIGKTKFGEFYVMKKFKNKFFKQIVSIGIMNTEFVEVKKGLSLGDVVKKDINS
jgi:RND family efflux transporter MFP subunit